MLNAEITENNSSLGSGIYSGSSNLHLEKTLIYYNTAIIGGLCLKDNSSINI